MGAGLAGVVADLAGARSLLVTVLVLVFIAVAPAAAIAGLLRGFDLFARLVLACVTAVAVITLIAMVMLTTGTWSPRAGLVAIALLSGVCVLARHAGRIRARIAERALLVRKALADYWVTPDRERTGDRATGPGTGPVDGKPPAGDGATGEMTIEPRILAADAVAGKPSSVRDNA